MPPLVARFYRCDCSEKDGSSLRPAQGHFLQTDPVGYLDDLALYTYVRNDPVNILDTLGLSGSCAGSRIGSDAGSICGVTDGEAISFASAEQYIQTSMRDDDAGCENCLTQVGDLVGRSPADQETAAQVNELANNENGRARFEVDGTTVEVVRRGDRVVVTMHKVNVTVTATGTLVDPPDRREVSLTNLAFTARGARVVSAPTTIRIYTGERTGRVLFETNAEMHLSVLGVPIRQAAGTYEVNPERGRSRR